MLDTDPLSVAAADYRREMGHVVPAEVLQMFAMRPGPLIVEIRQAIALNRPVKAWLAQSHRANTPPANWEWNGDARPARTDSEAAVPRPGGTGWRGA